MKKSSWIIHLYQDKDKKDLFKIMEFNTMKECSKVLDLPAQTISNFFHGLIKARGILEYCILYQSIPL